MPTFFATCAKGIEPVLAQELQRLGSTSVAPGTGGVSFSGDDALLYKANLWLRTANRVLLPLGEFPCIKERDLYDGVRALPWVEHLTPRMTLAVDATVRDSVLTHSHFVALKTKDAIVDVIRDHSGARPSVDVGNPAVRIAVRLFRNRATVSLDSSGESLHERGYRVRGGEAPLKETLAAAIVLLSEWQPTQALINPMCGIGTLATEAALLAADVAPGLRRSQFGFHRWRNFQAQRWDSLCKDAQERSKQGLARLSATPLIFASDRDPRAVAATKDNARTAGMAALIRVEQADLKAVKPPASSDSGVVLINPPYGQRLGEQENLAPLYTSIGDHLKQNFTGYTAYVLVGDLGLAKSIGLRTSKRITLYNGAIECRLLKYSLFRVQKS